MIGAAEGIDYGSGCRGESGVDELATATDCNYEIDSVTSANPVGPANTSDDDPGPVHGPYRASESGNKTWDPALVHGEVILT